MFPHRLGISSPDGIGRSTTVTLDGRTIHPTAIKLNIDGNSAVSAVIEFNGIMVEFDGLADVIAEIIDGS